MVNLKRSIGIDRYPKYIVSLAKPVQPPVRYWLSWFLYMNEKVCISAWEKKKQKDSFSNLWRIIGMFM